MNTFSLKLIACDKVFYDGPCEILIFDGFDGEMAIMANHARPRINATISPGSAEGGTGAPISGSQAGSGPA